MNQSSCADVRGSFTVSPSECQLISGLNSLDFQKTFTSQDTGGTSTKRQLGDKLSTGYFCASY
jgi:hypothetical protein